MASTVTILRSSVAPGGGTVVAAGERRIAVFHVNGAFYATDNTCPHRGGPLGEGSLDGATVTCPWHAWEFDVTTGACQMEPKLRVATYPVRVDGEQLVIEIP